MKRRPLNEIDTNKDPGFREDEEEPSMHVTRSRKRQAPAPKIVHDLSEEAEEEDSKNDSRETSTQESHEATGLKRPRRTATATRIVAPPPCSDGWATVPRGSVSESAAAAAAPPDAPARHRATSKTATRTTATRPTNRGIPPNVADIDLRRQNDPNYATAYAPDAYDFLRQLQFRYGPIPALRSMTVNPELRERTVNWMVSVVEDFAMSSDVLFLSVSIMDRALQIKKFLPGEFKLVACASMLLASKYEDVFSPSLAEFVHSTAEARYTRNDILKMEDQLLKLLDYRLMMATMKPFLRRFQRAAAVTMDEKVLSNFISEISLVPQYMLRFTPSLIAAASVYVARFILYKVFEGGVIYNADGEAVPTPALWTEELRFYTGYEAQELSLVVELLFHTLQSIHDERTCIFEAIERKYRNEMNLRRFPIARLAKMLPPITDDAFGEGGR